MGERWRDVSEDVRLPVIRRVLEMAALYLVSRVIDANCYWSTSCREQLAVGLRQYWERTEDRAYDGFDKRPLGKG